MNNLADDYPYLCDCGQRYSSLASLNHCTDAMHANAGGVAWAEAVTTHRANVELKSENYSEIDARASEATEAISQLREIATLKDQLDAARAAHTTLIEENTRLRERLKYLHARLCAFQLGVRVLDHDMETLIGQAQPS